MRILSKDSYFTEAVILGPHLEKLKMLDEWWYIDAQFKSGFDAEEVLELCEDADMHRVDAVVLTQCWLLWEMRDDEFKINCTEAERFFLPDGKIKTAAYLQYRKLANDDSQMDFTK